MQQRTGFNPPSFASYEVISLMIKHLRNELSPLIHEKVSDLIAGCQDCQQLYEEVKDFFNESEAFLFEINHKEEIESSKRQLDRLIATSMAPKAESDFPVTQELFDVLDSNCLCCGS